MRPPSDVIYSARTSAAAPMSSIFLSHSSQDNFEAVALRDWLAREGWDDVFLDLDPDRGIAAGERWERALHEQANRCEAVIFLVSANWLGSGWCLREYTLARTLNKKLFAVVIDPTKSIADLPPELKGTWQAVDLTGGQDGVLMPTRLPGSHEEKHVVFSKDGLQAAEARARQGRARPQVLRLAAGETIASARRIAASNRSRPPTPASSSAATRRSSRRRTSCAA